MPATSPQNDITLLSVVYQERKVFGFLWINPLTVPYDIATENTSLAVFILRFNSHVKHLLSVLPAYLQNKQAYYLIRPVKRNRKKPKACRTMGLMSFLTENGQEDGE